MKTTSQGTGRAPAVSVNTSPLDAARIAVVHEAIARRGSLALDSRTYRAFSANGISRGALDKLIAIMVERGEVVVGAGPAWVVVRLAERGK